MKRIASVLLAAVLALSFVFAFASCGELTAYQLVSDAVAKMNHLDAVDADVTLVVTFKMLGITADMTIASEMKVSGLKSENPICAVATTETAMGETTTANAYFEGDYCYVTEDGRSMKIAVGEATEDYEPLALSSFVKALPEALLASVEITKNEDGTKSVSVPVPVEQFAEIYADAGSEIGEELGGDVIFSDIVVTVTIDKKGYISRYELAFDLEMDEDAELSDAQLHATLAVVYNNPGAAVTVMPPEGYLDFEAFDPTKDAYTVMTNAIEKTTELGSLAASLKAEMDFETLGNTIKYSRESNVKASGLDTIRPTYNVFTADTFHTGQLMSSAAYFEDNYCYVTKDGRTMKIPVGEATDQYDDLMSIFVMLQEIPEELAETAEMIINNDGSKTIIVVVPAEQFEDIHGETVEKIKSMKADIFEAWKAVLSETQIVVTVDAEGYLTQYKLSFAMNLTESSVMPYDGMANVTVCATFENLGDDIKVVPPAGYLDFDELDFTKGTYAVLAAAVKRTLKLDSAEVNNAINVNLNMMGIAVDTSSDIRIKVAGLQGETAVSSAVIREFSMHYLVTEMEVYLEDNYCYLTANGESMKIKIDDAEEYDALTDIFDIMQPLPQNLLEDVALTETDTDAKMIFVSVPEEDFLKIYKDFIGEIAEDMDTYADAGTMKFSNINVDITVDEYGYIGGYGLSFDILMDYPMEGIIIPITAHVNVVVDYKNPGAAVTVTPPEGYQEFPEFDPSELDY